MEQYHILYKTVRPSTGEYYYGIHTTNNINDGYQGSGLRIKRLLKSKEHLITGIVEMFNNRQEAANREAEIVTEDLIKDPLCLNLRTGGLGGTPTEESRAKIAEACRNASEETKYRRGSANRGKNLSDETRQKMKQAHTGKVYSQEMRIQKARGFYVTPKGTFSSSVAASKVHGCSSEAIRRRCKSLKSEFSGYAYFKKR